MNDQRNHSTWPVLLAVWATFLLYGAIAAPVPGVNEPHYLCKAKHFWQPEWCAKDFFLASKNAHTVFFGTIGCLTNWFTLDQSAWVGRGLATLFLAWGWLRGLSPLFCTRWAPLWCAWVFLAFASIGNFSGEWLVGGVEGKVFCYAFLLIAFGEFLHGRKRVAAFWSGLAISFHPVVGVWGLLAFTGSLIMNQIIDSRRTKRSALPLANEPFVRFESKPGGSSVSRFPKIRDFLTACVQPVAIIFLVGLPGLIPVFRLLMEQIPEDTKYAANYIQVYFRLAHHLDPMRFSRSSYLGYAVLLLVYSFGLAWGGRSNFRRVFDSIVAWAVVFAIGGILIGYGPRPANLMPYYSERMNLLKFYPFRLADVLLPIAVAVSLVGVLERTLLRSTRAESRYFPSGFPAAMMLLLFIASLVRANSTADGNRYSTTDRRDWLDICRWIDTNLPTDALVQSPPNGWAFKWFARRAEYVAFKDCPQDAAGIVEWNRRLNFLQKWYEQKYADELYSAVELKDLRRETGLSHLLTDRLGPMELEPVYRNETFQVYDLRRLED